MVTDLIAGRYLPLERHAVGGMATVWRARDERTGEEVALKRIHPHLVADPVARTRLEREAAALRAVDHPAIVRPRDVIDDPDDPALVMDFAEGRPLGNRIAEGPLSSDEAVAIAMTIADALAVAHRRGIIHRDIKPANILVEGDGTLHLVDFGIASLADSGAGGLTDGRSMVGTLRYAAPERLAGEPASARSDVWALGAVLYEMLTGRPAIPVDDPAAALAAAWATARNMADLPPDLASVVSRAMAPEPLDRYVDAAAFRDALGALDAPVDPDAATAAVPVVLGRREDVEPWPPAARRRAMLLGGALTAVLLAFVAMASLAGPAGLEQADAGASQVAVPAVTPTIGATPVPTVDTGTQVGHGNGNRHGRGNGKGKD